MKEIITLSRRERRERAAIAAANRTAEAVECFRWFKQHYASLRRRKF